MQARVAEFYMRKRPLSRKEKLRVDLHGVSVFGPRSQHTLIRWEWITAMTVDDGIIIRSRNTEVKFPEGAFGLPSAELLQLLETARSIDRRGEVIGRLTTAG